MFQDILSSVILAVSFIIFVVLVQLSKKLYYYFRWRKNFHIIPKISIKGIAAIAMTISAAVVILMILTILSSGLFGALFRAYPSWRAMIEGVLVKLGGLLFGPVIGMIVGGAIDCVSVFLTAGMFHWGFLIIAIVSGLIAGFVRSILITCNKSIGLFALLGVLVTLVVATIALINIYQTHNLIIPFVGIKISKAALMTVFGVTVSITLIVTVIITLILFHKTFHWQLAKLLYFFRYGIKQNSLRRKLLTNKDTQQVADQNLYCIQKYIAKQQFSTKRIDELKYAADATKTNRTLICLLTVIFVVLISEIVNTLLEPSIDETINSLGFSQWLSLRCLLLVVVIPVNILFLFPIYRVVLPLVQYNYWESQTSSTINVKK